MLSSPVRRLYYYVAYLIFAVIYVVVSLLAPLGPNRFNLSTSSTHLLQLTILLPVVLIWLAAVYGSERFHNYSHSIRRFKDGRALHIFSSGLILLVAAIFINAFIGLLRPWALKDGWLAAYTIFANYTSVFLPLIAYFVMYSGSLQLLKTIKARPGRRSWIGIFIFVAIIGAIYIVNLLEYKYRLSTPDPSKYSSFYLSSPLIILTIALPYLIGWALALKTVVNLNRYRQRTSGVIYQRSLLRLEVGFLIVTVFYIVVQLLIAFSTYLAQAGLGSILFILYLLIILYAAGFLIIASGASRLAAIEKVK